MPRLRPTAPAGLGRAFVLAAVVVTEALAATAAHATTIPVTSTADDYDQGPNGNCTLREAVIAANTNTKTDQCPKGGGPDTIVIPAGTYTLTIPGTGEDAAHTGDLDVTAGVTITGAGVGATVIDVGGLDHGVEVRVKSGPVSISDLTISHAAGADAALRFGKLSLARVKLSGASNGGVVDGGSFALTDSTVTGNVSVGPGAGILVHGGDVVVAGSTIGDPAGEVGVCENGNLSFGPGGGIAMDGGSVRVEDSQIVANCSLINEAVGGGLAVLGGQASLTRVVVARNSAIGVIGPGGFGGGIAIDGGALALVESRISTNQSHSTSPAPTPNGLGARGSAHVEIDRSTFDGHLGVAISNGSPELLALRSSTVVGGAVEAGGPISVVDSTLALGSVPSSFTAVLSGAGTFSVTGSILDGECGSLELGIPTFHSLGFNVASDASCPLGQPTDLVGVDPHLAPLGFYGGLTPTRPPLRGSPAIDSGDPAGCSQTDQRGFARPADGDLDGSARCDRGAVEVACSGIDGSGDECVPLACGAIPRSPGAAATVVAPFAAVLALLGVWRSRRGRLWIAPLATTVVLTATAAHATTIPVTSTADDYDQGPNGNCTLREAVIAANTNTKTDQCPKGGGPDTIVIPAGTYTLTIPGTGEDAAHTGDLDITDGVTVVGAGEDGTILDANQLDQAIDVRAPSGTVSISGVTVRNAFGPAIANRAKLDLDLVTLADSTGLLPDHSGGGLYQPSGALTAHGLTVKAIGAPGLFVGGGTASVTSGSWLGDAQGVVVAAGSVTLVNATIRDSWAYAFGGGLAVLGGSVVVNGSTIGDASVVPGDGCSNAARGGGGIYVAGGSLSVADTTLVGNCAGVTFDAGNGGGLWVDGGVVTLERVQVRRNTASAGRFGTWGTGGGIYARAGSLTVRDSRIAENLAFAWDTSGFAVVGSAEAEVERSSVDGNAFWAVGVQLDPGSGQLTFRDSTITGRSIEAPLWSGAFSGGLKGAGQTTLIGSTVEGGFDPYGPGVVPAMSSAGPISIRGTIVDGPCELETIGALDSQGYNLASHPTCTLAQPTDLVGVDPHLAPLGFYGGLTPTRPPLPGSPAVDSGDPDGCTAADQRGFARPADGDRDGSSRCDRGAVEVACSGIDGHGDECVPLACGAIPRSPGRFAASGAPFVLALVAVRSLRARRSAR